MKVWKVVYNNDTGPEDDSFWEWYEVSDGNRTFKADLLEDALWLSDTLSKKDKNDSSN